MDPSNLDNKFVAVVRELNSALDADFCGEVDRESLSTLPAEISNIVINNNITNRLHLEHKYSRTTIYFKCPDYATWYRRYIHGPDTTTHFERYIIT